MPTTGGGNPRTAGRSCPPAKEMKKTEIIDRSRKFVEPYRVTNGTKFRLKDVDPGATGEATSEDKPRAEELLETGIQALAESRPKNLEPKSIQQTVNLNREISCCSKQDGISL